MTQGEQRIYYEKALADAIGEYKHVSCLVDAIRMCVTDIDFEEKFPVSQERYLLVEKMKASEGVQTNLRNSIRFYRAMLQANKPDPLEEDNAIRTVESPCGPVRLVNTEKEPKKQQDTPEIQYDKVKALVDNFNATHDKAARFRIAEHILLSVFGLAPEELNEIMEKEALNFNSVISAIQHGNEEATHHCGQDAKEEAHVSLNELLGKKVICVGGSAMKCEGCSWDCDNCVKVELVGGDYLCLAEPEQDKPNVINFDEEESNVMDDIKEKTEDFLTYLDSIFNTKEQ